jgi:hypothetical protein
MTNRPSFLLSGVPQELKLGPLLFLNGELTTPQYTQPDTAMLRCSLTSDRNETNVEHNQQFSLFNKLHLKKIDSSISELKTAKMLFVFANKFKWLENLNTQADEK